MTFPSRSNRDPWHGQSQVFSVLFHWTTHPRCVQTAENYGGLRSTLDLSRVRSGVDSSAMRFGRLGEPDQILHRMELSLPREAQSRAGLERLPGRPCHQVNSVHTCPVRSLELLIEDARIFAWRHEHVPVEAFELAGNVLQCDDRLT